MKVVPWANFTRKHPIFLIFWGSEMSLDKPMETKEQKFMRQTKEKYEALGRFLEAFELMVYSVREECISLIDADSLNKDRTDMLLKIVLHHSSLSAGPLSEIMRFMIAGIVTSHDSIFNENDKADVLNLLEYMADRFRGAVEKRNNLLHATWYIGSWFDPKKDDFSEIYAEKLKGGVSGIGKIDLPRDINKMVKYTWDFNRLQWLSTALGIFVRNYPMQTFDSLIKKGKKSYSATMAPQEIPF